MIGAGMLDGSIQPAQSVNVVERVQRCRYCGAPLAPAFYFCLYCATPYQSPDAVVPAVVMPAPTVEARVRRFAPHVMPMFWTYAITILAGAIVTFPLDNAELKMYIASGLLLLVTCFFAVRHWQSLAVQLVRPGFLRWEAWAALLVLPALIGVNWLWHGWLPREDIKFNFEFRTQVILLCIVPAIMEEIAFRGLVQHWLHVAVRPIVAMVLASALFTALHFSIYSAPIIFGTGMLLAWARWKTGSLYPGMLMHFSYNLAAILIFR